MTTRRLSTVAGVLAGLLASTNAPAQAPPPAWAPERLVSVDGKLQSVVFSELEIQTAKQRLAAFVGDRDLLVSAIESEVYGALSTSGESPPSEVIEPIEKTFAMVRQQLSELDRLTQSLPDQLQPVVAIQSFAAAEALATIAKSLRSGEPLPYGIRRSAPGPSSSQREHPSCGSVQAEADICSYKSPFLCKTQDFVACVKVSEGVLGFFVVLEAASPNDIMLIAFGSGVNVPSPIKVALTLILYLAKVAGQVGECYLDGKLECSYAQVLEFLQDENRWASNFEFTNTTESIQSAIMGGSEQISSGISMNRALAEAINDQLAVESAFASDGELFDTSAAIQTELAKLSDLACHLELLLRTPAGDRGQIERRCSETTTASDTPERLARRRNVVDPRRSPLHHENEIESRDLATLQLELTLLSQSRADDTAALGSETLERIRELVWDTIRAQRRLGIALSNTAAATRVALAADAMLEQQKWAAARDSYSEAYRLLLPEVGR